MKIYLVGGAVRDQLLGRPVTERDYVVVGSTPEEMLALGYKPVGKEFPVFLHPSTHEEYALARTEKKIAKGYKGFTFYASPEVTLEEDLIRRDLTINAMAQDQSGKIIDPFHGQHDLSQKILRHVSAAFAEDPVRILRLARFAARFPEFSVHPETITLMQKMTAAGEIDALVPERVWQEFNKALREISPERFFQVLNQANALKILFNPFANQLSKILPILQCATQITQDPLIRFATLFYDTPSETTFTFCKQIRAPQDYADLALLVSRYYKDYAQCLNYDAPQLLQLLEKLDVFRRKERFKKFLIAGEAIDIAQDSRKKDRLLLAYQAANQVPIAPLVAQGLQGEAIAAALKEQRIAMIKHSLVS